MNYYVKTVNDPRSLGCTIRTGADLVPEIEAGEECPLLPVSVVYGVCRVLRKSVALRDKLIPLSYFYRLPHKTRRGGPKIPRSRALWVKLPGGFLTLAGRTVWVRLLVAGDGITVTRILVNNPGSLFSPDVWEEVLTLQN